MMKMFKLGVCIAWAAVAVSSATPVSAYVLTNQSGDYGACSANYQANFYYDNCGSMDYFYTQTIRLISNSCNGGGCAEDMGTTRTDFIYGTGRKVAYFESSCTQNTYSLDSCAC